MSAEIARIQIEIDTKKQYIRTLDAKLLSETFISRAPEAVVRGEMEKRKTASEQIVKLEEKIGKMGG
jgi:valyl-tRNA synthetase